MSSKENITDNDMKIVRAISVQDLEKLDMLTRIYTRITDPDERGFCFSIFLKKIGESLQEADAKTIEFDNSGSPVEHAKAVEEAHKEIDALFTKANIRMGYLENRCRDIEKRLNRIERQNDAKNKKPVGEMTDAEIEAEAKRRVNFSDIAVRDIMQKMTDLLNEKELWPEVSRFAQAVGRRV